MSYVTRAISRPSYDVRMRGRAWLVAGAMALACGACTGDTEILVKVTRDASVPASVPKLRVYAAIANGQKMASGAAVFVDGADAQADVDVSSRDLLTNPYTLGLKPGGNLASNAAIQVAAVAFTVDGDGNDKAIAFGAIDHTISFTDKEVLTFELSLGGLPDGGVAIDTRGCADLKINGQEIHIAAANDWDCDGDPHGTDCNDLDPAINHMATEICGNNVDEDCSGAINDDTDADHDGYFACQGDCIDNPTAQLPGGLTAADVHPGATERLDNVIDENCDGTCEVGPLLDSDKDHYTTNGILTTPSMAGRCKKSDSLIDCDDTDKNINPGMTEVPGNGIDDDCNGTCDTDADGDGYTSSGYLEPPTMGHCAPIGNQQVDCNDNNASIHPGATEICDGIDENCDGKCDDDVDNDGYSVCGTVTPDPANCVVVVTGGGGCQVGQQCDCAPTFTGAHPVPSGGQAVPERCDGYDENCDGMLFPQDNGCFAAGPTAGSCFAGTRQCDDTNPTMPWGTCQIDTNQPVDPNLCTAYDMCFADATVADPFACATAKAALAVEGCHDAVGATVPPAGSCQPSFKALAQLVASATCTNATWQIYGGTTQGAWTVGFGDGGASGDKTSGCTATFSVTAWDHNVTAGTAPTRVLVTQWIGTQAVSEFIDLTAVDSGGVCNGINNLTCIP